MNLASKLIYITAAPPNKHMLRAGTHKVLGRGRSGLVPSQVLRARVLKRRRAGADVGRWATMTRHLFFRRCLLALAIALLMVEPTVVTSADNSTSRSGPILSANRVIAFLSSSDLDRSTRFYHDMLGLRVLEATPMLVVFETGGSQLRISKVDKPVVAPYTVLGWSVVGISQRVAELSSKGVRFERFPGLPQDATGLAKFSNGDQVAWFKDPEGHILSLTEFPER